MGDVKDRAAMPLVPALQTLADVRTDQVVIATMGSAREWPKLSTHPLDLVYVPSAMGHAPALGVGLALADPKREVIVLNGDGCMLMNLGGLVTIAASGARNLTLIVVENGVYEVTGRQKTAGSIVNVDFIATAKAAGIESTARFSDLAEWQSGIFAALNLPGPRFIVLDVAPVAGEYHVSSPGPMRERLARFRASFAPNHPT